MKTIKFPEAAQWHVLSKRPYLVESDVNKAVKSILQDVLNEGDAALFKLAETFDKCSLSDLQVSHNELLTAKNQIDRELKTAIQTAYYNIEKFHLSQRETPQKIETSKGISCWRKSIPIDRVGLYIPGGLTPLFSTLLMLGVPAKIAGCKSIVLCTPPNQEGDIDPTILYIASLLEIDEVYKVGGAQAIASLAYGTETIQKVNKIFGPGNQFVTKAKEIVSSQGVAIDMPAGPSEVLIIADKEANPAFIAADLLSQAEHGIDSQVVFVTNDINIINRVKYYISRQLPTLPRRDIITKALENTLFILLKSIEECIAFSNEYAPEHLIFALEPYEEYLDMITNAGSVFLGQYACESAGDYASGTNHTLPTNAHAKSYSGISLDSFIKKTTFQTITKEGIQNLGPTIEILAEAEKLMAHKNAITIRLNTINNEK